MHAAGKKIALLVLVLIAVGAVYFVFFNTDDQQLVNTGATEGTPSGIYLGNLSDLQGNVVNMEEDKLIFMNVWATWCGPCNMEMPGIQRLYDKYKSDKKMAFYIISDEDAETVNPFISRKGYALPFYRYTGPYPEALNGNAIPRTYIIYKGQILAQEVGASQWDRPEIIALIDKHLSQI